MFVFDESVSLHDVRYEVPLHTPEFETRDLGRSTHKAAQRSRTSMKVDDPAGTTIDNFITKHLRA